jgi:DNA-binding response OmpR family regulator
MTSELQVLLVEDDVRLARFTVEYLEKHETQVRTSSTGPTGCARP